MSIAQLLLRKVRLILTQDTTIKRRHHARLTPRERFVSHFPRAAFGSRCVLHLGEGTRRLYFPVHEYIGSDVSLYSLLVWQSWRCQCAPVRVFRRKAYSPPSRWKMLFCTVMLVA